MNKKKAICLISDGLDSPIATYLLERKGIEVIGLNFDNRPLVVPVKSIKKENISNGKPILGISQKLVNSFKDQTVFKLYVIPNGADLKNIMTMSGDQKVTCILCKRLMLRKAEFLAKKEEAEFIATGEILGEQASQTINNLKMIESVLKEKILLRPNIGLNKDEIIELARDIGTYEFSEISAKYTCGAVPNKPATKASVERIKQAEKKVKLNKSLNDNLAEAQIITLKKDNSSM